MERRYSLPEPMGRGAEPSPGEPSELRDFGGYMHRVFVWLMSAAVLTVVGCDEPAAIDGSSDAVLTGVVLRASGLPVASAGLTMLVVDSASGQTVFDDQFARADSTGHFSAHMGAFLTGPFTGRVRVTVQPPDAEQLPDTIVDAGFLRFGRQPPETTSTTIIYP